MPFQMEHILTTISRPVMSVHIKPQRGIRVHTSTHVNVMARRSVRFLILDNLKKNHQKSDIQP